MKRHVSLFPIILVTCIIGACHTEPYASFQGDFVSGPPCLERLSSFEASFYSMIVKETSTYLFLKSSDYSRNSKEDDVLSIVYLGGGQPTLDHPYPLSSPLDTGAEVVVQLLPNRSCKKSELSLYLTGNITFSQFGSKKGSRIVGSVEQGKVIDVRGNTTVFDNYSGTFSAEVEVAPPHRLFP